MARYTAKLLAAIKHAYEETDRPVDLIATDFDVSSRNIQRLVVTENWQSRRVRKHKPRDVPVALELLAQAQALAACSQETLLTRSRCSASASLLEENGGQRPPTPSPPLASHAEGGEPREPAAPPLSAADLLEARVRQEIEALGDGGGARHGFRIADAERRARTLATLTQTLHSLQRLRDGSAPAAEVHYDDDLPADPDAFRDELARRIRAFVKSRSEDGGAVQR
jgi:hypothetical protein